MSARKMSSLRQLSIMKRTFSVAIVLLGLVASGWASEKNLITFQGTNGSVPYGRLIFDKDGNLYGTTAFGGANSCKCGLVFKLAPTSSGEWTETILYTFKGGSDGSTPTAGLIFDEAGTLYGTTFYGGSSNCLSGCGTVFRLRQDSNGAWSERVLYQFGGGADGANPNGSLVLDSLGNLYGTTSCTAGDCTILGRGTAFKLTHSSRVTWTETVLHSFTVDGQDGLYPMAGLAFDRHGNLYGTTLEGGPGNLGTVFQLSPVGTGWNYSQIFTFGTLPSGGKWPYDSLIIGGKGKLYGATSAGGISKICIGGVEGCGTVFELSQDSNGIWTESVLHPFNGGSDGAGPIGSLAFDTKGNVYSTTAAGGDSACTGGCGTIVKLTQSGGAWTEDVVFRFGLDTGWAPETGVVLDSQGNLYGTTIERGVVFEFTP